MEADPEDSTGEQERHDEGNQNKEEAESGMDETEVGGTCAAVPVSEEEEGTHQEEALAPEADTEEEEEELEEEDGVLLLSARGGRCIDEIVAVLQYGPKGAAAM